MTKLEKNYYREKNALALSQALLGKFVFTQSPEGITGGMIVETEAYQGPEDRACHAYNNRRTARTEVMFWEGGVSYVYLCYGIHHLLNVVCEKEGIPHAVLIRAIEPIEGIALMQKRRNKKRVESDLTAGPGALTQALGITQDHNGMDLGGESLWIEDRGVELPKTNMIATPRIGIDYAGEDAKLPWRFCWKDHPWTSPARKSY